MFSGGGGGGGGSKGHIEMERVNEATFQVTLSYHGAPFISRHVALFINLSYYATFLFKT